MKSSHTLTVIVAVLFALIACKKDALVAVNNPGNGGSTGGTGNTVPTTPGKVKTTPDPGVYMVGSRAHPDPEAAKPIIWKDNNPRELSYDIGSASAICAQDTNLLIAGSEAIPGIGSNACFWFNKTLIRLTYNNLRGGGAYAAAIAASGKDIYVAGIAVSITRTPRPVYWKNGIEKTLSSSGFAGIAGMVVKDGDVYVAGNHSSVGCYWKNGVLHPMQIPDFNTSVTGIAMDGGGNIYLSGAVRNAPKLPALPGPTRPVYWKNDQLIELQHDMVNATATGIAVNGNNVYVSGTADDGKGNTKAVLWTNGKHKYLPNGSSAKSIYAIHDEVYVTGVRRIDPLTNYGVVWKDDEIIAQGAFTNFNGILVIK